MALESGTKGVAAVLVALLAVSALGYLAYGNYKKREFRAAVVELVRDTSRRFEDALAIEGGPASAETAQTVHGLDENAQEVDKHVIELHGMAASPDRALADAAEEYLLTVREILRKQAASHRYRIQVGGSDAALRDHMRGAGRRSKAWIDEAVRLKDRLEKDYFDYRLSAEAFGRLLDAYPQSRQKLAAQAAAAPLTRDEAAQAARRRATQNLKRVEEQVQQDRQLAAVR
jgi:hypothetical protein